MNRVKAFILRYPLNGKRGDVLVLLPSGDVYIAETVGKAPLDLLASANITIRNGGGEPPPPSKPELSAAMSNRLYAATKLPEIRERCTALYGLIALHPGLRATDYTNLMRDAGHKLQDGVEGRAMIQRHLKTLVHIEAIQMSGIPKQPSYTVS